MIGIDPHEAATRQSNFIFRADHPLLAKLIGLLEARLHLLLNRQRYFQGQGVHRLDQQLPDRPVEAGPAQALANPLATLDPLPLADVYRLELPVVTNGHALTADPANGHSL